jgi:hypothetical protein
MTLKRVVNAAGALTWCLAAANWTDWQERAKSMHPGVWRMGCVDQASLAVMARRAPRGPPKAERRR